MRTSTKVIIGFIAGGGLGFAAGYGFAKYKLEKRFNDAAEDLKELTKNYKKAEKAITEYRNTTDEVTDTNDTQSERTQNSEGTSKLPVAISSLDDPHPVTPAAEYVAYDTFSKVAPKMAAVVPEGTTNLPNIEYISDATVMAADGFNKVEILYFDEDDTLCDEDYNVLDIGSTIGAADALDHFDDYNLDMLYVRNHRTQTDYIVSKIHNSYYKYVDGAGDQTFTYSNGLNFENDDPNEILDEDD